MTKIRSKQQLIDAAAKVFAEKGYEAARIEDIAAELGVLQGSVYYHIDSKAGLLRLVQRSRFREMMTQIEDIANGTEPPRDKLKKAIRAQLRYIERYLPESSHWFTNPPDPRKTQEETEEFRSAMQRHRENWKAIIRAGIRSGDIRRNVDPSVAVLSILGMTNYVARWYREGSRRSIEQIANQQFDMIWAGMSTRED
ncbi:TetR/AcrR family transcriptional regulator [Amycolatopsis sp. GM8]|uniref:TetR/AcrR family transcriptional regulator n=1 Tax=Amycolatopsis sp. GM8 TaxID=2896530 RepID=UPI001F476F43|nr:TetR/AcrR family transcriptional regulator [Amycolatopsis sp. GM8]